VLAVEEVMRVFFIRERLMKEYEIRFLAKVMNQMKAELVKGEGEKE